MADVTIKYKGSTIAEMSDTGSKTLKTSETYCEGDIEVSYAPNSKTYEITLAKSSGWVLLTTLDDEVIEHINDPTLVVSLSRISEYVYEKFTGSMFICSNTPLGYNGDYPVYGITAIETGSTSATTTQANQMFYPPNKTDTNTSIGGRGAFRIDGTKYYVNQISYYLAAGTYRLTFTW